MGRDRCIAWSCYFGHASNGSSNWTDHGFALDRVVQTPHQHFVSSYLSSAGVTLGQYAVPYGERRDLVERRL